uniref:Disease resistance N-terminal domain-containing protein n=1 Tax=Opuntia streptacantha TaxID=393608 RepID=A0A7C8Z379_OPUST
MEAASTYLIVPFLSGLFNVLIDRLASEKTRRLLMGQGLSEDQLAELEDSLTKVRRAVNDAEKKQDDDPDVKVWLMQEFFISSSIVIYQLCILFFLIKMGS